MDRVANLIFPIALILSAPTVALSCMCSYASFTPDYAYYRAEVIFVGKVVKISDAKHVSTTLLVKEAGTLEVLKVPRWENVSDRVWIVTLEVTESFKGKTGPTFQLMSARYNRGANCGVNFKTGESYLVYANPRQQEWIDELEELPSAETRLKVEANRSNEHLPNFQTNICNRTERLRFMQKDLEIIRNILKNGPPIAPGEEPKPTPVPLQRFLVVTC